MRVETRVNDIILICGARRTGTTLMNQILCCDPRTHAQVGEARFLAKLIELYDWSEENYHNVVKWYFTDRQTYENYFGRMLTDCLGHAEAALDPVDILVLKTPSFSRHIETAFKLLPQSRALVCVRSPFDQVVSEYEVGLRQIEQGMKKANRASKRDFAGLARGYMNAYAPLLSASDTHPDRVRFVRYEDVVNRTRETLSDLETAFGLDLSGYDPESEWRDFRNREELSRMPAHVAQYGAPLDAERVGRYTDILTPDEYDTVSRICERMIGRFYEEHRIG